MTTSAPPLDYVGPYRVIRPIARGGMAEVYEVEDPTSAERFALKLLMMQGSALPRFNREYEALARLNHPNIVRVYQYGVHEVGPWVAMELLQGTPLQSWVKSIGKAGDPVRTREVIRIMSYVADALHYIHRRGLVHRDLKSDNVLMLPDGRIKLLDFGAARVVDAIDPITKDGEFVGTFAYAAPEQLTGAVVDARADIYALGVLMYRMATGQRPFETNDPLELARLHAKTRPPSPRERVPAIPEALDRLIQAMMEKRPDARPEKASLVAQSLREMAGPLPTPGLALVASPDQAVGREPEMRRVVDALKAADPGGAVLIEGAEGSGRVRFVRAVSALFEDRNTLVLQATLSPDRSLAEVLGLLEQIGNPLRQGGSPEARASVEALQRQLGQGGFEGHRRREAIRKAAGIVLTQRARLEGRDMLLVIHNLHHATSSALDILVGLRREAYNAHSAVRLLASLREEVDEHDTIVRQRLPDALVIRLVPLGLRGIALTVGTMLHRRPAPQALARAVLQASGGQPAFVEEVVRELVQNHQIEARGQDGNRLEWSGKSGPLGLAPSARRTADDQLRRLPRMHRRVLDTLAVAGSDVPTRVAAAGAGLTVEEVRPLLDQLQHLGFLRVDSATEQVRWDHPTAQAVLDGDLHPSRREITRRALLVALRAVPAHPVRVKLLLQIDQVAEASTVAVACAERLLDEGRVGLAVELLDEVVRRLTLKDGRSLAPELVPNTPELYLQHARALLILRPTEPMAARSLTRAGEHARDDAQRAAVAWYRARVQSAIGHYPNFRKYLHEAWDLAGKAQSPRLSSAIAVQLGQTYQWIGQPKTAGDWLEKGRVTAKASGSAAAEGYAAAALATHKLAHGDILEAERLAKDAITRFEGIGHIRGVWSALPAWTNALREQGRFTESLAALSAALPAVRDAESPTHHVELLLAAARQEIDLFRLGKAQELLDELEATIRSGEHLHLRLEARLLRGRILLASGVYKDAVTVLADVHQRARSAEIIGLAEIARALRGEALWWLGQRDEAQASFRDATLGLLGSGDYVALTEAITVQARTIAEQQDAESLFAPVRSVLDWQPIHRVKIEALIARARHLQARGDPTAAFHAWREAATLLNKIATHLDDIERAALRVHPWSRVIRRGLRP